MAAEPETIVSQPWVSFFHSLTAGKMVSVANQIEAYPIVSGELVNLVANHSSHSPMDGTGRRKASLLWFFLSQLCTNGWMPFGPFCLFTYSLLTGMDLKDQFSFRRFTNRLNNNNNTHTTTISQANPCRQNTQTKAKGSGSNNNKYQQLHTDFVFLSRCVLVGLCSNFTYSPLCLLALHNYTCSTPYLLSVSGTSHLTPVYIYIFPQDLILS